MAASCSQSCLVAAFLVALLALCALVQCGQYDKYMYNMGLGKRYAQPYSFGLGKRPDRHSFAFGLGKRAGMADDEVADVEGPYEPDYLWDNDAEKRSGRGAYSFGLGKRAADPRKSFYSFGLGKRDIAIQVQRNPPVTAIDHKPAPVEAGQHQ